MRVFVTGVAGFIGKALVPELLSHGHQVIGLARSDASAEIIAKLGAEVHRGDIQDVESLKEGAKSADGVIHLAFMMDLENFSKFPMWCAVDRAAITAMAEVFAGSGKPLVIAMGTLAMPKGVLATEDMEPLRNIPISDRVKSEDLIETLSKEKQIRGSVVRLSPVVHAAGGAGFIKTFADAARKQGAATYVGDGASRWPAVHRDDAATLFRLALEHGEPGAKYHGVAEEGVLMRDIWTVIGKKLSLPVKSVSMEEAVKGVGHLAYLMSADSPASSEKTRTDLQWSPTRIGLLADVEANYF